MDASSRVRRAASRRAQLPELRPRRVRKRRVGPAPPATGRREDDPARSDVATDNSVPDAAVLGHPGRQGHRRWPTTRRYLDERAHVPRASGACEGRAAATARRTRSWSRPRAGRGCGCGWTGSQTENLLEAAVVYGYFPCVQRGQRPRRAARRGPAEAGAGPVHLPAPAPRPAPVPGRLLPVADESEQRRVRTSSPSSWSRWAPQVAEATAELFAKNAYRDYLELHGLSVQLTEALAEYWHARVREELGFGADDDPDAGRDPAPGLPRLALLVRLPGLPRPGGPGQAGRAARPGAHRRRAVRGAPAAPRAVDRRARRAPPRGQVLQRHVSGRCETPARRRPVGHGRHAGRHRAVLDRRRVRPGRAEHGGHWSDEHAHAPRRQRPARLGRSTSASTAGSTSRRPRSSSSCSTGVVAGCASTVPWRPGARELLARAAPSAGCPARWSPCPTAARGRRRVGAAARHVRGRRHRRRGAARQAAPRAVPDRRGGASASTPRECVAIEDSATGAASAQAAGCAVIAVPHVVPAPAGAGNRRGRHPRGTVARRPRPRGRAAPGVPPPDPASRRMWSG